MLVCVVVNFKSSNVSVGYSILSDKEIVDLSFYIL